MDDLEFAVRYNSALKNGIDIRTMSLKDGKIAIIKPGNDFLLLPEELNANNTWYCGSREQACAFIEGLIMGSKFEQTRAKRRAEKS